jgi:hypothetical protein
VGNRVNVALHMVSGRVRGATGYSVASDEVNVRVVIGDEVTFVFDVRWYEGLGLPDSAKRTGGGGKVVVWLFGVLVGGAVCWAWMGWERRRTREFLPKYNGYGYGAQGGNAFGGMGKRE